MRLLLVEDDVMVASGIKLGLSDAGYAVDWVGSAERALEVIPAKDGHGAPEYKWTQVTAGSLSAIDYDVAVRDLVNYLVYMGEPAATTRKRLGVLVLFGLGVLFIFAYALKKEFWKDVK